MDENDVTLPRAVHIGGMTKVELLFALQQIGIQLNDIAKVLFAHQGFTTAEARSVLKDCRSLGGPTGSHARCHDRGNFCKCGRAGSVAMSA